jgi:hypothetical protein
MIDMLKLVIYAYSQEKRDKEGTMKRISAVGVVLASLLTAMAMGQQSKGTRPGKPAEPQKAASTVETILRNHCKLDVDGDGVFEIEELSLLDRTPIAYKPNAGLVVIFVEPRLLSLPSGRTMGRDNASQDLLDRLDRFQKDLSAEGFPNHLVKAQVYSGTSHQDGQTVIGLRRLLRAFRGTYPGLKGAIFVGSFPEPMIVRKWLWKRPAEGLTIGGKICSQGSEYLRIVPEIISERSDLVLADLTGNWDTLYHKGPYSISSIEALPDKKLAADEPRVGQRIASRQFNRTNLTFSDLFLIDDTDLSFHSESPTLDFSVKSLLKHPELTGPNRNAPNPISRPEIFISRINARQIAVNPDPNFRGIAGKAFLDDKRNPQTVVSAAKLTLDEYIFWKRDAAFERRLLIEYFDRNHRFRTTRPSGQKIQAAVVAYPQKDFTAEAIAKWMKSQCPDIQVRKQEDANLAAYVAWLKGSGSILFVDAHSTSMFSEFGASHDGAPALESAVGGTPWRWAEDGTQTVNGRKGYRYKPTFLDQGGKADLHLHRSIYESGLLASTTPRIYIHKGCQANSPLWAETYPYNHLYYGAFQTVEGVLFYLNGVAVVARAKVFYDPPEDFITGLTSANGNIGKGWEAYFRYSSNDAALAKDPAGCKRSYTWSVLGDWTLRVR